MWTGKLIISERAIAKSIASVLQNKIRVVVSNNACHLDLMLASTGQLFTWDVGVTYLRPVLWKKIFIKHIVSCWHTRLSLIYALNSYKTYSRRLSLHIGRWSNFNRKTSATFIISKTNIIIWPYTHSYTLKK